MKTYSGHRDGHLDSTAVVTVTVKEGVRHRTRVLKPDASLKVRSHSPTGFNWGYGGSGPAQLALAILLDLYPDRGKEWAQGIYQAFKFKVIAGLADEWTLTEEQIATAVEECAHA